MALKSEILQMDKIDTSHYNRIVNHCRILQLFIRGAETLHRIFRKRWLIYENLKGQAEEYEWKNDEKCGLMLLQLCDSVEPKMKEDLRSGKVDLWDVIVTNFAIQVVSKAILKYGVETNKEEDEQINAISELKNTIIAHRKSELSDDELSMYWKQLAGILIKIGDNPSDIEALKKNLMELGQSTFNVNTNNTKSEVAKLKEDANNLFKAKKFDEAIQVYTKILDISGTSTENQAVIYANRSASYLLLKTEDSLKMAQGDADWAVQLYPCWWRGYYRLGRAQAELGNLIDSVKSFNIAKALNPQSKEVNDELGAVRRKVRRKQREAEINDLATKLGFEWNVDVKFKKGQSRQEENNDLAKKKIGTKSANFLYSQESKHLLMEPLHTFRNIQTVDILETICLCFEESGFINCSSFDECEEVFRQKILATIGFECSSRRVKAFLSIANKEDIQKSIADNQYNVQLKRDFGIAAFNYKDIANAVSEKYFNKLKDEFIKLFLSQNLVIDFGKSYEELKKHAVRYVEQTVRSTLAKSGYVIEIISYYNNLLDIILNIPLEEGHTFVNQEVDYYKKLISYNKQFEKKKNISWGFERWLVYFNKEIIKNRYANVINFIIGRDNISNEARTIQMMQDMKKAFSWSMIIFTQDSINKELIPVEFFKSTAQIDIIVDELFEHRKYTKAKLQMFLNIIKSDSEALQNNEISKELQTKLQVQRNYLNTIEGEEFQKEIDEGDKFFNIFFHFYALLSEMMTVFINHFCKNNITRRTEAGDRFSSFFKTKKNLGKGAFGRVLEVDLNIQAHTGQNINIVNNPKNPFAVKIIEVKKKNKIDPNNMVRSNEFVKEMDIIKSLCHENIIKTYDSWIQYNYYHYLFTRRNYFHCYIVMELCEGSLSSYLMRRKFDENVNLQVIKDVLSALEFLHGKKIVHRDIKPENILWKTYNGKKRYLLADFGLVKILHGGTIYETNNDEIDIERNNKINKIIMTTNIGTKDYIAPEVQDGNYDHKIDIFSMGIVIAKLYGIKLNYIYYETNKNILKELKIEKRRRRYQRSETIKSIEEIKNIVVEMISFESHSRPEAFELRQQFIEYSKVILEDKPQEACIEACNKLETNNYANLNSKVFLLLLQEVIKQWLDEDEKEDAKIKQVRKLMEQIKTECMSPHEFQELYKIFGKNITTSENLIELCSETTLNIYLRKALRNMII